MKIPVKLLKGGAVILGVLLFLAVLSFAKVLLNEGNNGSGKIAAAEPAENVTATDVATPPGAMEIEQAVMQKPEDTPAPLMTETKQETGDNDSQKDLYHDVMADFCKAALEPLGFVLSTDEYSTEEQNTVILYFDRKYEMSFEAMKLAAIKLGEYTYLGFEERTGFKTDYLKVHLKLPEGDSFSLKRENYENWVKTGTNNEMLFEKYIDNAFSKGKKGDKSPEAFKAKDLEDYLRKTMNDGLNYKVDGSEMVDPGIYITIDKARKEIDETQREDMIVRLVQEVFRNYYRDTNQRVGAFKLIDNTNDVFFVIYRKDVEVLWPEGTGEERIRAYIKNNGLGLPLN